MPTTLDAATERLAAAVSMLDGVGADLRAGTNLLAILGWAPPPGASALLLAGLDFTLLNARLAELLERRTSGADELAQLEALGRVGVALAGLFEAVEHCAQGLAATPEYLAATGIKSAFFPRLSELLLIQAIGVTRPAALPIGLLLGVIELTPYSADPSIFQVEHVRQVIRWDRLARLFTDPTSLPREVYGWGTPEYRPKALMANLAMLFDQFSVGGQVRRLPRRVEELLAGRAVPEADTDPAQQLLFSLHKGLGADPLDVGLSLYPLRASVAGGSDGGLGLSPYAVGTAETRFALSKQLALVLDSSVDLAGGLALVLRAGEAPALKTGLVRPASGGGAGTLTLALQHDAPEGARHTLLSLPGLTLDAQALSLGLGIEVADDVQPRLEVKLIGGQLRVTPAADDGFLASLLPSEGAKLDFDLGMSWSARDGVRLNGDAALRTRLGAIGAFGPLKLDAVDLSLEANGDALRLSAGLDVRMHLGPVTISLAGIGTTMALRFTRGNLGPADLGAAFKPPTGLGIVIDAHGVATGGGFFDHDPVTHEYSGALELQIGPLGLKAIGILTPRDHNEWSLLLLVYTQFPAIQLAFGFTLNGVGGLIGVQHGVDIPQLIAGMKTGAFDDILFPAHPVADAPRIINRLRTLFPYTPRALIVAPMVDIGYGTPRYVFIRIGVVVQLENVFGQGDGQVRFSRAALIGQLKVLLGPSKSDPTTTVVQLIVDVLGFWDRDQRRYGVIARLRDSKIASVAITGSLAVWGDYGAQPRFLLAAGGFHPRFKDVPTEISGVLDRLGAAFEVGRFKLSIAAYFAMSPGTIQFGVDIAASAKIGPVAIKGNIGFDALIYREPRTYFLVDFRVSVEISYKGHSLASVKCVGLIEGPGLWHVAGKVSFSILWWDIDKSFDETWGRSPELGTVTTDVRALLAAEMVRAENWSAQLPDGMQAMVTLAPRPGDNTLLAHPIGRAVFVQHVVPLGLALQRYGSTKVAGPNKFELTAVKLGGLPVPLSTCPPVQEHFARAQYLDMSEDDKLARPSFEPMDAGLEFSSAAFHPSASVLSATLDFETAYIDFAEVGGNPTIGPRRTDKRKPASLRLDHGIVGPLAASGAAGRAPQRHDERHAAKTRSRISLGNAPLSAATRDTLAADPSVKLVAQAQRALMLAEQRISPAVAGRVQLVETFELA